MSKKSIGRIYGYVKRHIVDTTGVLVTSNPLFTISENVIGGMPDEVSMANRIDGSILFYLGAGSIFSKGRDFYYKLLNIENSKYKGVHDAAFGAMFGALFNGAVTATNTQSLEDIAAGAVAGAITGSITGVPAGYAIDTFRDLTDINTSKRLPPKIRNLPSKLKKCLAVGLIAASIGLMGGIYKATPENFQGLKGYISNQSQNSPMRNNNKSFINLNFY